MKLRLRIEQGAHAGREYTFAEPERFLIGRAREAHLRLPQDDGFVSRNHCVIEAYPPRLFVTDLDSTNGTFVNGTRTAHALLASGDSLRVGRTVLSVELLEEAAAEAPPPPALPQPRPVGAAPRPVTVFCRECGSLLQTSADPGAEPEEVALYQCSDCFARQDRQETGSFGPYQALRRLGQGGMGVVYLARHRGTGRLAAVKRLRSGAMDDRAARMFEREMAVMSELRHPHIVRLLEQGRAGDEPYFVSEYLEDGDLGSLVSQVLQAPMGPTEVATLMIQVLRGLQYAHERGYVHRDIKPENLLVWGTRTGRRAVKITDFGLAKSFPEAGASFITRGKEAAGTLVYMAPEQILNYRFVKPPADVYSVGVTAYYLLTGLLPFNLPSELERVLGQAAGRKYKNDLLIVLEDEPLPVRERDPEIPEALAAVVDRAIRKPVAQRYQSAAEMCGDLERWAAECPPRS